MMVSKKIVAAGATLAFCLAVTGCAQPVADTDDGVKADTTSATTNTLNFSAGPPKDPVTPKPLSDDIEPVAVQEMPEGIPVKINPARIYQPNETIKLTSGKASVKIEFSNPKCYRSSELPKDISADEVYLSNDFFVEGTSQLLDGMECVFVDVDMQSVGDSGTVFNVGSLGCAFTDADLVVIGETSEIQNYSAARDLHSKDFYSLAFAENEKKRVTFMYIIEKSVVDAGEIYFAVHDGESANYADDSAGWVYDHRKFFALQF